MVVGINIKSKTKVNIMKRMLLVLSVAALSVGQANASLLPPTGVQHELSITIDANGAVTEVLNTDPNVNKYDTATHTAYLVNERPANPVKHAWMYAVFNVALGTTWIPAGNQSFCLVTPDPNNYLVSETGKEWQQSGSSMQYLEVWQTWDIKPNPQAESFDLSGFFANNSGLTLRSLDIQTVCVPEPTTVMAGALLLIPFGVSTIRKLRRHSVA